MVSPDTTSGGGTVTSGLVRVLPGFKAGDGDSGGRKTPQNIRDGVRHW